MIRFLVSALVALVIGIVAGLYLGWVQFPARATDSPASALASLYKDDYTVMIAAGYLADRDITGALERMRVLGVENVPAFVQDVTERYISNSFAIDDIRKLVALAEGLGRLTPLMEPYRPLPPMPGAGDGL